MVLYGWKIVQCNQSLASSRRGSSFRLSDAVRNPPCPSHDESMLFIRQWCSIRSRQSKNYCRLQLLSNNCKPTVLCILLCSYFIKKRRRSIVPPFHRIPAVQHGLSPHPPKQQLPTTQPTNDILHSVVIEIASFIPVHHLPTYLHYALSV